MEFTSETAHCPSCDSAVELPASFCDMCGTRLTTAAASDRITAAGWKGLTIMIVIPSVAVGFGFYLLVSRNLHAGNALLLLLTLIIGTVAGAANSDFINNLHSSLTDWTLANLNDGSGKRHRFFFKPWHWLLHCRQMQLQSVISVEQKITNPYVRSGFSVAAFLYIWAFMFLIAYIAISTFIAIVIIGIAFWIVSMFLDGRVTPTSATLKNMRRTKTAAEKLVRKKTYGTKGIFRCEVGYADESGRVQDTTGVIRRQVAEINKYGNMSDTTGFKNKKVAGIDRNGPILDTKGVFNKEVGKVK